MSNIKYYTNVILTLLYSKLLEKGMPVNLVTLKRELLLI